jgi:hypothetical protein
MLAIHQHNMSSGGNDWIASVSLPAPSGTLAFSPTICAEPGTSGSNSINVAVVTGRDLWVASTPRLPTAFDFGPWTKVGGDAASAPDCVVMRDNPSAEAQIHVVALTSRGSVMDAHGGGTTWTTTDLGFPR